MTGEKIHQLAQRLWSLNRSITGDGVRETLKIIKSELPALVINEIPSGTEVFDWTVPREWRVRDAYIRAPNGYKFCEFSKSNLNLVGYSKPVRSVMSLRELKDHLYTLPEQPNAVPYVTSYYKEHWGFCIKYQEYLGLEEGQYEVVVDSEFFNGSLTYGELFIPGCSTAEIFLSTYICHPSMANNELSGPCVTTFIARELSRSTRKFSYRIVFLPETIGSIAYLSKNLADLKSKVIAGFNVTCMGDDRAYSYLPSRGGNTLSDKVARHVLRHLCPDYKSYSWLDRGSDERQYCAPGVDLPIASIMRSMYGTYDEYHTSLDNLSDVVVPEGLEGGFNALLRALFAIEENCFPKIEVLCEPQLSKRGLYPTVSTKYWGGDAKLMSDFISYCDGFHSLLEIADLLNVPIWKLYPIVEILCAHKLLSKLESPLNAASAWS